MKDEAATGGGDNPSVVTLASDDEWPGAVTDGLVTPCIECGLVPMLDYTVTDRLWEWIVPLENRAGVICLSCLIEMATGHEDLVVFALRRIQLAAGGVTTACEARTIYDYRAKASLKMDAE